MKEPKEIKDKEDGKENDKDKEEEDKRRRGRKEGRKFANNKLVPYPDLSPFLCEVQSTPGDDDGKLDSNPPPEFPELLLFRFTWAGPQNCFLRKHNIFFLRFFLPFVCVPTAYSIVHRTYTWALFCSCCWFLFDFKFCFRQK